MIQSFCVMFLLPGGMFFFFSVLFPEEWSSIFFLCSWMTILLQKTKSFKSCSNKVYLNGSLNSNKATQKVHWPTWIKLEPHMTGFSANLHGELKKGLNFSMFSSNRKLERIKESLRGRFFLKTVEIKFNLIETNHVELEWH